MSIPVLFDANVWYSRTLTDWCFLLFLGSDKDVEPPFFPAWTEDIVAEAQYHLRRNNPHAPVGAISKRFKRIRGALAEWEISGFAVGKYGYADIHDHHVLSAAVAGNVQYVVTSDRGLVDYVGSQQFLFDVLTPDDFFCHIFEAFPGLCKRVAQENEAYWEKVKGIKAADRPITAVMLERSGCPNFATVIDYVLR